MCMPKTNQKLKHFLLTWDSLNNGFQVAVRAVDLLHVHHDIQINTILYLQDKNLSEQNLAELKTFRDPSQWGREEGNLPKDHKKYQDRLAYVAEKAGEWEEFSMKPQVEQKRIHLSSITHYQSIYDQLRTFLHDWEAEQKQAFQLHINVSPGTPQMHVVWLMLNASGFLPLNTKLWSTQYDREKDKQILNPVNFKPRTYLSEVLQRNSRLAVGPNVNPNATNSTARKTAIEKLEWFASLPSIPLLILGERGVGKSTLVRKHIHERLLPEIPYYELACGTFREELFRAELFGYQKGAFTGASSDKKGILDAFKEDGILFLDEIHDLSSPLQRELIQVLQTGEFYPIGSTKAQKARFRLITASNLSLAALHSPKVLAPDFFDRIVHAFVEIPPLRECKEDLEAYWKITWELVAGKNEPAIWNKRLAEFLASAQLSGNFRDLQRLAAQILVHYLSLRKKNPAKAVQLGCQAFLSFHEQLSFPQSKGPGYFKPEATFKEMEAHFRFDLVQQSEKYYGSIEKAAEVLGRAVSTLYQDKSKHKNADS